MKLLLYPLLFSGLALLCHPLSAQPFNALHLDGDDDAVSLPLGGTPLAGNPAGFTVKVWFWSEETSTNTNCGGSFRRLFSLGNVGTRVELGVCGNALNFYMSIPAQPTVNTTSFATITPNTWNQLSVVRSGTQLTVYLNCNPVFTQAITGNPNFANFYLGRWPGGNTTPPQEWLGLVDEVSLWDVDLTQADLCNCLNCPLSGNESGLQAYWTFNEGVAGGNNTGLTQVTDASPNGNAGLFSTDLALTGPTSNLVASTAPIVYPALHDLSLEIHDYPYRNNLLTGICSGDPTHFCLYENGQTPGPFSNVQVQWEYSDDGGGSWTPLASPPFTDFCFPILPGVLAIDCAASTTGFVDRRFRATSTATDPTSGLQCEYLSDEQDLRICCPISPATVSISPSGTFCEGDALNFQVNLNSPDLFVQTPGPHVTIDWFFDDPLSGRIPIPSAAQQTSFTYPFTAPNVNGVTTTFCFEAEVRNCQGKLGLFSACFSVDPQPVCGTIAGWPLGAPQNLQLVTASPLVYDICPGSDAVLAMATPFQYCIPQWQYSFDISVPTPVWTNMGLSNSRQNTNILPSHLWPAGATSIYYRIQCNPLSNPSGCDPCFSNIVEIRLIDAPPPGAVSGPLQVCKENTPVTLAVSSPIAGHTYTWYHDGLPAGNGTSITALVGGCYWFETSNGCQTVSSPQHCLEVCETVAVLSCPLPPNECATIGQPITLDACDSYSSCDPSGPLTYTWYIDGVLDAGLTGCTITHTPALAGTTYRVEVFDPVTGCIGSAERTAVPCDTSSN